MRDFAIVVLILFAIGPPCWGQQEQQELARKPLWEEELYGSMGFGFGITFPIGMMSGIMDLGTSVEMSGALGINFPWGALSFGLQGGAIGHTANPEVTSPYNLGSLPIALSVRYDTRFMVPFFLSAALSGGAVINLINYRDTFYDERSRTNAKMFLAPAIGVGLYISRDFGISIWQSMPMILFEGTAYTGSTLSLRVEYYL